MAVERELLVSILKLTKRGPIQRELVSRDARIPIQTANDMLRKFCDEGVIRLRGKTIEASPRQRVKVAIRAIESGADLERVCKALEWIEFENITSEVFEVNGYHVKKRFRFKWFGRRWEVDVVGRKEPMVLCADCKHWLRGWRRSAIVKTVGLQLERTEALADALPFLREKLELTNWRQATLVPVVISLVPASLKFYNNVPIVPILQLQNFLSELEGHVDLLMHLTTILQH